MMDDFVDNVPSRRPWCRRLTLFTPIILAALPLVNSWSSSHRIHSLTTRTTASSTAPLSLSSTAAEVDEKYYSPSWGASELEVRDYSGTMSTSNVPPGAKITLTRWLSAKVQDYPELRDMESLHLSIQMACKTISNLIHSSKLSSGVSSSTDGKSIDNSMKRLDQISKNVLQNALRFSGKLLVVEAPRTTENNEEGPAPHQPGVTIAYALDQYGKDGMRKKTRKDNVDAKWGNARRLAACFDPLDGSGNADAAICTGTVVSNNLLQAVVWRQTIDRWGA